MLGATGPQGDAGPHGDAGLQGEAGPQGDTGAAGANGVSGHVIVTASGTNTAVASCPSGKKVIGGGGDATGSATVTGSYPSSATAWTATKGGGTSSNSVTAYAICATVNRPEPRTCGTGEPPVPHCRRRP